MEEAVKFYALTLKPRSPFGTPLVGDTIFGHFCWQAVEDPQLLDGGLDYWIEKYPEHPFAVFSSAWPKVVNDQDIHFAIKRPDIPLTWLGDPEGTSDCKKYLEDRKRNKKRKWLLIGDDLRVNLTWDNLLDDHALYERIFAGLSEEEQKSVRNAPVKYRRPISTAEQQHNTINRVIMTTGKGFFAPYVMENIHFLPGMELVVFAWINKEATDIDRIKYAMEQIGRWGFGRDASTGLGRFDLTEIEEMTWPEPNSYDSCLALAPCVPEAGVFRASYFTPFIRYGRHGAQLIHKGRPFKNPVAMASEGAVFCPKMAQIFEKPYIGRAVTNISKAQETAVAQGYAIYLPMSLPKGDEANV